MQGKINDCVIISGYVTRDAEIKYVGEKQTPLATFSVAVNKPEGDPVYVNCNAWRDWASLAYRLRKGMPVCCMGTIQQREYTSKNGDIRTVKDLNCESIQSPVFYTIPEPIQETIDSFTDVETPEDLPF